MLEYAPLDDRLGARQLRTAAYGFAADHGFRGRMSSGPRAPEVPLVHLEIRHPPPHDRRHLRTMAAAFGHVIPRTSSEQAPPRPRHCSLRRTSWSTREDPCRGSARADPTAAYPGLLLRHAASKGLRGGYRRPSRTSTSRRVSPAIPGRRRRQSTGPIRLPPGGDEARQPTGVWPYHDHSSSMTTQSTAG